MIEECVEHTLSTGSSFSNSTRRYQLESYVARQKCASTIHLLYTGTRDAEELEEGSFQVDKDTYSKIHFGI